MAYKDSYYDPDDPHGSVPMSDEIRENSERDNDVDDEWYRDPYEDDNE